MSATATDTGNPVMDAREEVVRLLRRVFPRHTAKRASEAAGGVVSHRTVQDYLQRRSEPTASVLFAWAHDRRLRAGLQALLRALDNAEERLMAEINGQGSLDFSAPAEAVRRVPVARRAPSRSSQPFRPARSAPALRRQTG